MGSNTAERWWVRRAARWLARLDGVSKQLRLAMLVMTGLSTATITLKQYGHGRWAVPLIGATGVGILVYTYLYTEAGVWNQMQRDRVDLSTNFAGPTMKMDDTLIGVALFAAMQNRPPNEDEFEAIEEAVGMYWHEYRDGIEVEDE
jgi:hypothetical protein